MGFCFKTCLLSSALVCYWDNSHLHSPAETLRSDYASASSPRLTCPRTGCTDVSSYRYHYTSAMFQTMQRTLHSGSATSAPHQIAGQHATPRGLCGEVTMLLRWHSDERTLAKGLCMESMTSMMLFTASSWLPAVQGSSR